MAGDKIERFPEIHELAFVVGADENLVAYDNDRWHAVVMRQESEPGFANTLQRFIHVYFREGVGLEIFSLEGLECGEYEFMSNGCRKQTPEDLAFKLTLANAVQLATEGEQRLNDPKVIQAESHFVNHALKNRPEPWQPTDHHIEQMEFWITMFFEQDEDDD